MKQPDAMMQRKKAAFLAAYAKCGNISQAAEEAGIDRSTLYDWQNRYPDFADPSKKVRESLTARSSIFEEPQDTATFERLTSTQETLILALLDPENRA